ncbi:MAG: phospho-sugar mutase [Clostridiales bacterium]|jgi:phosphoglucomutase|nr:phospho-sugar mutase [Clostridiales bacterium]
MDYKQIYLQWLSASLPPELAAELAAIKNDDGAIKDRFFGELEFRTAGMRGILGAGTARMNYITVNRATKGLADYIVSLGAEAMLQGVVIAYDTRRYSFEFALSAAKVLSYNGIKVYLFDDVRPVPMGSFAVRHLKAAAGIIITASHNPKEYNGYKVYGADGAQMGIEATEEVVGYISKTDAFAVKTAPVQATTLSDVKGKDGQKLDENINIIGKRIDDAYFNEISKLALSPDEVKAAGHRIKIVYTPLHGSGYMPVTAILKKMDIDVTVVEAQKNPDYDFSTVSAPNPEQPDALKLGIELAGRIDADAVIGTDPDGDRMGVAIRTADGYTLLTGNQTGALLLDYILLRKKETGTLPVNAAAVKTIVTTELAACVARFYGCAIVDVLTGFKFIGEKIKEWESSGEYSFIFGYEESYGYLCGTHARDKDAVVAAMLFSEMLCYYRCKNTDLLSKLNGLYWQFGCFSEKNISVSYSGADAMRQMSDTMSRLRSRGVREFAKTAVSFTDDYDTRIRTYPSGEQQPITLPKSDVLYYSLKSGGFICVRPSGTEPKLKIYVSVSKPTQAEADAYAEALLSFAKGLL